MAKQPSRFNDDLIRPEDVAADGLRKAETAVKRRVFRVEDRAAVRQADLFRDLFRDLRDDAEAIGQRLDVQRVEPTRAGNGWRVAFTRHMERRIDSYRAPVAAAALRDVSRAWALGYYGRAWALDESTNVETLVRMARVSPAAVAQQAANLLVYEDIYDDLIMRPELGEFRALYDNELDALTTDLRRAVRTGMDEGESIDGIMRRVRDAIGLPVEWMGYRRGSAVILSGTRRRFNAVQLLTRTAVNKASNDGAARLYRENADVLTGYRWIAARDERTCAECRGLNGRFFRLESQFRPPAHPLCRCTIVPEIQAELAWLDGPQRTFAEWMRAQQLGEWLEGAV